MWPFAERRWIGFKAGVSAAPMLASVDGKRGQGMLGPTDAFSHQGRDFSP